MPVRAVEGKKPYTGGKAIEIDENKVISLRLRDENNLIIWDEGDNEIYVDLQLDDEIRPTDAFPVGVTTGRVIVDNGWDATGTIICAKTTSGDNIKLFYADNGNLYIDNGTGTFKQIYFKGDVDAIAAALQNQIDTIMGLGKFLSIWNCATGLPTTFPLDLPYEYTTGDWYLVGVVDNTTNYKPNGSQFTGVASTTVETDAPVINDVYIYDGTTWMRQVNSGVGGGVTFAQIIGQPTDNQNLATALGAKQDSLTLPATPTQGNLVTRGADNETLVDGGAVPTSFAPGGTATTGYVVTKTANGYEWSAPSGGDVKYSDFEIATATSGATLTISDLTTEFVPTVDFTMSAGTVKEGMQYIVRIDSGATAYTLTLGTGITNPFGEDLTLTASKMTTVVLLATSSSALEVFSVRTAS